MTCNNLFSKCFNSIISKFPGKLSDLIILGKAYQHPCISSIRITIAMFVLHCFQIIAHFKANTAPTSECNDSSVQTFVSSVQRRFGLLIGKVISIGNDVLIWK
jgi:hypothetical protein